MRNLSLLDRLLILIVAILVVAALVGLIKFDMRRTAASPAPIHGALGGQLWLSEPTDNRSQPAIRQRLRLIAVFSQGIRNAASAS